MQKNSKSEKKNDEKNYKQNEGNFSGDPSEMRKAPGYENAVPGVNSPEIAPPRFNPPVPNRAWTEMRRNLEIEAMTEQKRRELYGGGNTLV